MDDNKAKNIFEAAGQSRKPVKPAVSPSEKTESAGKDEPSKKSSVDNSSNKYHVDPEINEMFEKMYEMQDDLQTKVTTVYERSGVSVKEIQNYLDNPNNFTTEVWAEMQAQKAALEEKIRIALNKSVKKSSRISEQKGSISKERNAKTLGSRKNWISM